MVLVKYYRYKVAYEEKYETLRQAMAMSYSDFEHGHSAAYEIIDGNTVYDAVAILEYWRDNFEDGE